MDAVIGLLRELFLFVCYMVPGFIAIGLIIYIHELGHFFMARLMHVDADTLCYGFGPTIWSYQGRRTEFRISLIPFGGYCRMKGADDLTYALQDNEEIVENAEAGSYFSIHPWKKFFIYLAGPLTNLLVAFLLLSIVSAVPVERLSDPAVLSPISSYESLFHADIDQPELHKGDIALRSGKTSFEDYQSFASYLQDHAGKSIPLTVLRDGKETEIILYPTKNGKTYSYGITNLQDTVIGRTESDLFMEGDHIIEVNGNKVENTLDFYALPIEDASYTFLIENGRNLRTVEFQGDKLPFAWNSAIRISPDSKAPFRKAYNRCYSLVTSTAKAIGKLLSFQFNEALSVISGPFSSATTFTKISTIAIQTSAGSGFRTILYLLSVVSVSICLGNMIPIPAFDGGQLLVSLFEIIRRRPLRAKSYMVLHIVGLFGAWGLILIMNTWPYISRLLH
ncbi:MAG: RIP metalloprotease RseP [Spirochaetales bacterium]|nr:RIP metalloprotease RseP [Candidatus Physcosoma equi]